MGVGYCEFRDLGIVDLGIVDLGIEGLRD